MAVLPFGLWDVGENFNQAVDLEEEEQDQYIGEDETEITKYELKCHGKSLEAEKLIIAVGDAANAFMRIYFDLPDKPMAEVVSTGEKEKKDATTNKKKQSCNIYKLGDSLICLCQVYMKPESCYEWVEKVLSAVQTKEVVVYSSYTKSVFQGDEDLRYSDADVLRFLKTKTMELQNNSVTELETGNIIGNLPASVLSYCELFKRPAVLYINYTESHYVDVFALKAYEPSLSCLLFSSIPKATKQSVFERLKTFEGIGVADNNLYI